MKVGDKIEVMWDMAQAVWVNCARDGGDLWKVGDHVEKWTFPQIIGRVTKVDDEGFYLVMVKEIIRK